MSQSRRSFLADSAAAGCLFTWLANSEIAQAEASATQRSMRPTTGGTYWKNLYSSSAQRGEVKTPDPNRDPRIVHYSDKTGLRWAEDIKLEELPPFTEDAVVNMELSGLRAGSKDTSKLAKVKFAQLHLSCQRVTGSEFLGPLVWAALATVFTKNANKIQSSQNLSWSALTGDQAQQQPGPSQTSAPQLSHMVLNQGAGHLSVNVTSTPANSLLDKILAGTVGITKVMAPLLGFPGIALAGLENFYTFYGQLEKSLPENFLLNGAQQDVIVTQPGADNSLISKGALKLVTGEYILLPKAHEDDLQKDMDKLIVQNGFLIERDAKGTPDSRVAEAIPTVSYVTMSVKVQPASSFPVTSTVTDPLLDSLTKPAKSAGGNHSSNK